MLFSSMVTMASVCAAAWGGVELGSYGRVQVSTDARGGEGDPVNVVAHGTRLEKGPYLELDVLFQQETEGGPAFDVLVTPALQGELFHYDGEWDADLAVWNLYVQARDFSPLPLQLWAGSRMLRGDDVHLLDFWPLDEVNTVGGGAFLSPGDWRFSVHGGLNRLAGDEYQVQWTELPVPGGVGEEEVLTMDRERLVATAKAGRMFGEDVVYRLQAYGELQHLPSGTRVVEDFVEETLPADTGSVLGLQASAWGWGRDAFVHLWYTRATGLGAYGDLAVPWDGYATDYTVEAARKHQVALAGNTENERLGLLVGGYLSRFADADGLTSDVDDGWEGILALRPQLFVGESVALGAEVSHQVASRDGVNPRTGTHDVAQVTKPAVLPALKPRSGSFARPQVRLQYVFTYMNDGARKWYADEDVRHAFNYHHFIGVGAEWWLNSKSYR